MMRKALAVAGRKAGLVAGGLLLLSIGYWAGVGIFTPSANTSHVTDTTVTSPAETTPAPSPVVEPDAKAPAAPAEVVTEPAPEPEPVPAPQLPADGSLPEGWLPPSVPGGPPTAPMAPLPPAPCMPGEGGERCGPGAD